MRAREEETRQRAAFLQHGFASAWKEGIHTDIVVKPGTGPAIPAHKAILVSGLPAGPYNTSGRRTSWLGRTGPGLFRILNRSSLSAHELHARSIRAGRAVGGVPAHAVRRRPLQGPRRRLHLAPGALPRRPVPPARLPLHRRSGGARRRRRRGQPGPGAAAARAPRRGRQVRRAVPEAGMRGAAGGGRGAPERAADA
jgi:hypothetical protein